MLSISACASVSECTETTGIGVSVEREWAPDAEGPPGLFELRGQNAEHLIGDPVEQLRLADDLGVGSKALAPEAVRQQEYVILSRQILLRNGDSSDRGFEAEHRQHTSRGQHHDNLFWMITRGEVGGIE
jgi:hypothetical protein